MVVNAVRYCISTEEGVASAPPVLCEIGSAVEWIERLLLKR